jgi:hypothetical protein
LLQSASNSSPKFPPPEELHMRQDRKKIEFSPPHPATGLGSAVHRSSALSAAAGWAAVARHPRTRAAASRAAALHRIHIRTRTRAASGLRLINRLRLHRRRSDICVPASPGEPRPAPATKWR